MHFTQNYPSLSTVAENPMEEVNAFNDYRKPTSGPFAETYNPGWRLSIRKNFYANHGSYVIGMLKKTNPVININRGSNIKSLINGQLIHHIFSKV
jgi:hypothetical protein